MHEMVVQVLEEAFNKRARPTGRPPRRTDTFAYGRCHGPDGAEGALMPSASCVGYFIGAGP